MLSKFINHCEDSLTASIFSHLLYFPNEVFWDILKEACYSNELPAIPGEPLEINYWPSWNSSHTENSVRVEPDLFIRFADFDLIIEAKRWDDKQQYRGQWEKEVQAYINEYASEEQPLYFIALGGLNKEESEEILFTQKEFPNDEVQPDYKEYICPVIKARWAPILRSVKRHLRELSSCTFSSSQVSAQRRVCESIIHFLGSHGFSTGKWINDFDFTPNLGRSTYSPFKFNTNN